MSHTIAETLAQVNATKAKVDNLISYTQGIKTQLDAALAGWLPPAQQAQVDAIFDAAVAAATGTDTLLGNTTPTANTP